MQLNMSLRMLPPPTCDVKAQSQAVGDDTHMVDAALQTDCIIGNTIDQFDEVRDVGDEVQ